MRKVLFLLLLVFFVGKTQVIAQKNDSLSTKYENENIHSPKKAALLSLVPGLGQAYNKKYWKIPIIYIGLGTTIYFITDNTKGLNRYKAAYTSRLDTIKTNDLMPYYTIEDIKVIKDIYWKNRDLSYILTALIFTLNIVDATVDAHLFTFDMDKNLSFRVEPNFQLQPYSFSSFAPNAGVKFTFKF